MAAAGRAPGRPAPNSRMAAAAPRFVTGDIRRHILVMTGAGAVGLMAIFVVDLANILFISMLGDVEAVAAIGYASSLVFFTISIGIGLSIAATAVVAPALGAGLRVRARRIATNALVFTAAVAGCLAAVLWLAAPHLLAALGAAGRTHMLATDFVRIILPTMPMLAVGMTCAAVLRSAGDARRSMYVTLSGAAVSLMLDPLLILGAGLGVHGAAIASAVSRIAVMAVGLHGVVVVHRLARRPKPATLPRDARLLSAIAVPAILANIATPASNAYVTASMAAFGDDAVAGWALIGRILPVAFGSIYAITGSVGPVLGQNFGAGDRARVRQTLTQSLVMATLFALTAWIALLVLSGGIVAMFAASGEAAGLVLAFCRWFAPLFVFLGALFIANAALNTLGRPHWSTAFNWGRATLGTVPFVHLGGWLLGSNGVVAGSLVGAIPFGIAAVIVCYRLIDTVPMHDRRA